jgi:hypothetical protein
MFFYRNRFFRELSKGQRNPPELVAAAGGTATTLKCGRE